MLAPTAAGVAILGACAITGASLLRLLRLPDLPAVQGLAAATVAGVGGVSLLLFAMGAVGWLAPLPALAAVTLLTLAASLHVRPVTGARSAWRAMRALTEGNAGTVLLFAGALVLAAVAYFASVPLRDWDSMMYHLPVPQRFLEEGTVLGEPVTAHYGYVGAVHMLYVLALAMGQPGAAVVVSGLLALLLVAFVLSHGVEQLGPGPGALAAAGLAGSTILAFVAVTPRIDAALALFLLMAHWAVLRAHRGAPTQFVVAAGILGGVALATKITAGVYLAPLVLWALWITGRRRTWRTAAVAVAVATLVAGPWLARNAILFDDALFPLLGDADVPPWMASYPGVSEAAASVDGDVVGRARQPVRIGTLLSAPQLLSPEPEAAHYVWSPLVVVGAVLVLFTPAAWPWILPAALYAWAVLGRSGRTNLRYLIPLLAPIALGAAISIRQMADRWLSSRPRMKAWALGLLFAAALAPLYVPLARSWELTRRPIRMYDTIYAIAELTSERVPPEGVILMLYEARTFPFERTVLPDNRAMVWPLLHESGLTGDCLRALPATHVLINTGAIAFYSGRGGRPIRHVSDGALQRFAERCMDVVERRGPHVLFRLRR